MYEVIEIPTYDLILLIIACILIGYWTGKFVTEWKRFK